MRSIDADEDGGFSTSADRVPATERRPETAAIPIRPAAGCSRGRPNPNQPPALRRPPDPTSRRPLTRPPRTADFEGHAALAQGDGEREERRVGVFGHRESGELTERDAPQRPSGTLGRMGAESG